MKTKGLKYGWNIQEETKVMSASGKPGRGNSENYGAEAQKVQFGQSTRQEKCNLPMGDSH